MCTFHFLCCCFIESKISDLEVTVYVLAASNDQKNKFDEQVYSLEASVTSVEVFDNLDEFIERFLSNESQNTWL